MEKQLLLVHSSRQGIPYLGNPELHLCHFFCLSREGEVGDSVWGSTLLCTLQEQSRIFFPAKATDVAALVGKQSLCF